MTRQDAAHRYTAYLPCGALGQGSRFPISAGLDDCLKRNGMEFGSVSRGSFGKTVWRKSSTE
jgi:hypothetical protein